METIAIYWEPIIKTYGLFRSRGLVLLSKLVPPEAVADVGRLLADGGFERQPEIALISAAAASDGSLRLSVVVHPDVTGSLSAFDTLWKQIAAIDEASRTVDLLYFQGPHFGDRFGIAHAVQSDLACIGLIPLLLVCSASSVYIVLPSGTLDRAAAALSRSFQHPSDDVTP